MRRDYAPRVIESELADPRFQGRQPPTSFLNPAGQVFNTLE
jgi:hypothetical protein